jgi:phosphoheptose isomerase
VNVEFLKDVARAVAQDQRLETVMKTIVEGINEEPDVALAPRTQGISVQTVIYGRSAQTKLVACI